MTDANDNTQNTTDVQDRLDRLESLVEAQQETVQQQRERIDKLESEKSTGVQVSRRDALKAGGLLAALGFGAGTASADPQGQVGTSSDPLSALYTAELNGGVTGDVVTDLTGTALGIDGSGGLTATDARIDVDDGGTTVTNVEGITFGAGLMVTDDGDRVTIDR